jgi:glycosyltransferase involved in cell wall biosynthesis
LKFALVSREIQPLVGGGIAPYVTTLANLLSTVAEVTLVTSSEHEERYLELVAEHHPGLPDPAVRVAFAPKLDPDDVGSYFDMTHRYSAGIYETLRELYPDGAPDVIEFPDYLAEGTVTIQAARTGDPWLRRTRIAVRIHSTSEVTHVLNGWAGSSIEDRTRFDLERYCLRYADEVLYGGGDVYATYQRFYGADRLAPGRMIRHPITEGPSAGPLAEELARGERPLRMLLVGRFERRKGVQNLIRALTALRGDRWRLTMVGGDTRTAPLGLSLREQIGLMVDEDPRIEMLGRVAPEHVREMVTTHDAMVLPSLWECWPTVGLEAMRSNRPLLATPVGGLVDMTDAGGGLLAGGTSADDLLDLIESVVAAPDRLVDLTRAYAPRRRFDELTDRNGIVEAYRAMAERAGRGCSTAPPRRAAPSPPLVSVVIPYYRLHAHVTETIESLYEQTYPNFEVLIVNDGSLNEEDRVLEALAGRFPLEVVTQPNRGLSAARNFGVAVSRGSYVLPFDADDLLHPSFIERCVGVLEEDPRLAYVTSWLAYMNEDGEHDPALGEGYQPISNDFSIMAEANVAGSAITVFRREVFDQLDYDVDLTSYEDWLFFRELLAQGLIGHVIPERLIRYRVRAKSMLRSTGVPRRERLIEEMNAHYRRKQVQWTALT